MMNSKNSPPKSGALGELSLTKTLNNPDAFGMFMAFARDDFSEENLEFWMEINDLGGKWDSKSEGADAETCSAAQSELCKAIIGTYLKAGAPKQVCIGDYKVKETLDLAEAGTFSRDMFDEAQRIAERTLAQDIFPRFTESVPGIELRRRPELCE